MERAENRDYFCISRKLPDLCYFVEKLVVLNHFSLVNQASVLRFGVQLHNTSEKRLYFRQCGNNGFFGRCFIHQNPPIFVNMAFDMTRKIDFLIVRHAVHNLDGTRLKLPTDCASWTSATSRFDCFKEEITSRRLHLMDTTCISKSNLSSSSWRPRT